MYECLTKLIDSMDIGRLWKEIYDFSDVHPEYELRNYCDILARNNLEWEYTSMRGADVSSADGHLVMALLMGATRAERFCDGAFQEFCDDGSVIKWLKRLKELDQ